MNRIRRLLTHMTAPTCCGQSMDWDVFRASWVCSTCGVAR